MMKTRSRMMKKCRNLKNEIKTRLGTFFAAAFSFVNRLQNKDQLARPGCNHGQRMGFGPFR